MLKPWLPVPHRIQQHKADCLTACVAMVLDYLGRSVSYNRLMELLNINPDLGAPASNVGRLSSLGLQVEYGPGQADQLTEHLDNGIPCVVFVDTVHLSYWAEAARHAVVLIGMDEQQVFLNAPFFTEAPQIASRLEFELAWDEMDNTYAAITS